MGCRNAKFDIDNWFECTVTGESCRFITPSSRECAKRFNEGPDAKGVNDGMRDISNKR